MYNDNNMYAIEYCHECGREFLRDTLFKFCSDECEYDHCHGNIVPKRYDDYGPEVLAVMNSPYWPAVKLLAVIMDPFMYTVMRQLAKHVDLSYEAVRRIAVGQLGWEHNCALSIAGVITP